MSARIPESDLPALWQNLEAEVTTVSIEQIQQEAMKFQEKNRRDRIARLVFAVVASAFCGFVVTTARYTSVRVVAALVTVMVLGTAIRSVHLAFRGRAAGPWSSCVEFYRSELERQRAFAALPAWQIVAALSVIAWLTPGALSRNSADPLAIVLPAVLLAAAAFVLLMAVRKFQARHVHAALEALNSFSIEDHRGGDDDVTAFK
jgi:hypothetical protein